MRLVKLTTAFWPAVAARQPDPALVPEGPALEEARVVVPRGRLAPRGCMYEERKSNDYR